MARGRVAIPTRDRPVSKYRTVALDEETYQRLDEIARMTRRSRLEIVRRLVRRADVGKKGA